MATDEYGDSTLRRLAAPQADADALAAVLADQAIGGYAVQVIRNAPAHEVNRAIDDFFADRSVHDTLLLYFSGHGVKDDAGRLHLATIDSRASRLPSTSVSSAFVRDQMDRSRSRRIVLLLDCCYSGAFPSGLHPRAAQSIDLADRFGGRGIVVIAASTALEYAFEPAGDRLEVLSRVGPSIFTAAVVEGLRTGEADLNGDGLIGVAELYEYVYERVRAESPQQTPTMMSSLEGDWYLARSVRRSDARGILPPEIVNALASPVPAIRVAQLDALAGLASNPTSSIAPAARAALEALAHDESGRVADAALAVLASLDGVPRSRPVRYADDGDHRTAAGERTLDGPPSETAQAEAIPQPVQSDQWTAMGEPTIEEPPAGRISPDGRFQWDGREWKQMAPGYRGATTWTRPLQLVTAGLFVLGVFNWLVSAALFVRVDTVARVTRAQNPSMPEETIQSVANLSVLLGWTVAVVISFALLLLAAASLRARRWAFWGNLVWLALSSVGVITSLLALSANPANLQVPQGEFALSLLLSLAALALLIWYIVALARYGPWAMKRPGT